MLRKAVLFLTLCAIVKNAVSIIGGRETHTFFHPYIVSICPRYNVDEPYEHKCAGSIYTAEAIITAAQCLTDLKDNDRLMIKVAANTRTSGDGELYPAAKWFIHPNYTFWTMDYDIGVVILEEPLDLSRSNLKSIPLRESRPITGSLGQIIGWGYREEYGNESERLQQGEVPIVSEDDCYEAYGSEEITERMLCAGYLQRGGIDTCQGDNGGPLVVNGELVGITSWGRGCARPNYPSVYTFPGSVKDWIDNTIINNKV